MAEHELHSSFIKTPQQLITVVLLAFVVPVVGIVLLVQLVLGRPHADPAALAPEAVAARLQPVGKIEFGSAGVAGGAPRTGEEIVKNVCAACHQAGVLGAPKIGDKASWAPHLKAGLDPLVKSAIKGVTVKGTMVMQPRGGAPDLSDYEVARAIVHMANQSGGSLKEPPAPAPASATPAPAKPAAPKK